MSVPQRQYHKKGINKGIIVNRRQNYITSVHSNLLKLILAGNTYENAMILLIDSILERRIDPKEIPMFVQEIDQLFLVAFNRTPIKTIIYMNDQALKNLRKTFQ